MSAISVIVPVYKVEPYIHRCVDSILAQEFTDFELILVDDGSPDNCGGICDEYARKDGRVHVIHQKNAGLSAARNAGINWVFTNSNSHWLSFVDSDDWIHPMMLEYLFCAVTEKHVKVGICGYAETSGENPEVHTDLLSVQLWGPEEFFVNHNINAVVAWGKLYHRECFNTVRYPIGKLHEDEFITYKIIFSYDEIVVIDAPLYQYFQNPEGIMKSNWTPKRLDGLEARREQIKFFKEHHYKKAELKIVKALLWGTKDQLEQVMELGQKKNIRYLKKMLRREIQKYKSVLKLSPGKNSDLYEAAYPEWMRMYWLWKMILRKLHLGSR